VRLAELYLRSRLAGYVLIALSVVTVAAQLAALWITYRDPTDVERYLVPVMIFAPLIAACVVGVSTHSPFGDVECTAARSLPALRLGHLASLLACGALILVLVSLTWDQDYAARLLVRNLAGLLGLAFIAARLLGSLLSWSLPVVFVSITPFVSHGRSGEPAWWVWLEQPVADPLSWAIAFALLVSGLGSVCLYGAREVAGETE
jgi:hypothetical protein